MNRLKLLAAVALLGIPLAACEEATPPPPVGSITGTVSIEGTGVDGVSVNLSNGNSTTTAGGGSYRFDNVEGGAYTVTISGFPSDATFDATSAAATISSAGQSVTVNFTGAYIRTASVMGSVTVENMGLPGVTVTLTGVSGATATTDDSGQYAFTGLRMGSYSVEISSFDSDEVGFSSTSASVTVGVGESKIVSFDGTYLRTAGIMGRVSVDGEGLPNVTVSLAGGPDNTDMTTMTDAAGQYSFAKLRGGDYAVGISGYDTDDYEFEVTSQNVTVALGETANVPFEGVLLRTAGISGRVSVEGIGLEGVMVTLSMADADDMTAMTDAGGLYAFAGLAAGDYTVAIALSDEQMAAYVFDMTSMDVTVGDDETAIVNFEAEHAATASVTVQLFVDELMKNDMMDDGEMAFPSAEMLALAGQLGLPLQLPVTLAGPGVHDMQQGMVTPTGQVVFSGLKAGQYQVVSDISDEVLAALPPALGNVLRDYAYGGPATGYPLAVTVGQQAMQYAPVDITHTTINVAVTLKATVDSVDHRGMGVAGAAVTLYSDAMGETKVGEGMTMMDEAGHAYTSIRVARDGTTGHTVHMGVSTDDYWVDPTAGMQAVTWNPMSPLHPLPTAMPPAVLNDANILNLAVDVMVGGATVTTDYGGGDALAGWLIGVQSGTDPTALETVEGDDVPTMLDADGMASFARMVAPTDLPATYHFGVAPDQDDDLDGGERFEGTAVSHTHTGLTLAGTVDAGMIEVAYTTQTLKVYVHHELDQVMGYTGNILGGDERDDGKVSVDIRYIDDNGRSRAFTNADSISTPRGNGSKGVWTFSNVPADYNVIATVSDAQDPAADGYESIMLLDPDELAAYTALDENGVMGGAFGAMGGFNHTVELCPLMATDPTSQDHGECASFAYVMTHSVSGLVWKNQVLRSNTSANDDGFKMGAKDDGGPTFVPGITVSLDPVEGKNLAGDAESATTTEKAVRTPGENSAGTSILDETHQFDFGDIAAGVYKLGLTDGWRARLGPKDATEMVGDNLNPLAGDIELDVTPTTTTVYGYVRDSEDFPVEDVTVTVNGVEATSDVHGRYIAEYVPNVASRKIGNVTHRNMIFVETKHEGNTATRSDPIPFAANTRIMEDVELSGVGKTASISGTVTASGSGDPIAGAEIKVDGSPPNNVAKSGINKGKLVTGADGTYTAIFDAKELGETAAVSAEKKGLSFSPAELCCYPAHAGSESSGANFTGFLHATISGRVKDPDGNAMSGVTVTATNAIPSGSGDATSTTSNARGTFVLSVPFGTYTITAAAENYTFSYPLRGNVVSVAPGQASDFGDIQAMTFGALKVSAVRQRTADDGDAANGDETERLDGQIRVSWSADSTALPAGYDQVGYQVQDNFNNTPAGFADAGAAAVADTSGLATFASPTDSAFMVMVVATATDTGTDGFDDTGSPAALTPMVINSAMITVGAVDPTASNVAARRGATADTTVADTLTVTWNAVTNGSSEFRILVEVDSEAVGNTVWLVVAAGDPTTIEDTTRSWKLEWIHDFAATWNTVGGTTVAITDVELNKPFRVRVDSRQGSTGDFTEGTPVSVP